MMTREQQALGDLKERLRAQDWELDAPPFIAGFSPQSDRMGALTQFELERAILFPLRMPQSSWNTWVQRTYIFRRQQAETAVQITVVVDRLGSAGAVDGLLLHLVQAQRERSLSADRANGRVEIHESGVTARHFLRRNIGISVESLGGTEEIVPRLASDIDSALRQRPTAQDLAAAEQTPKIVRFEPIARIVETGGETGLVLEIKDEHPPLSVNFQTDIGAVNLQTTPELRRYFRAGPAPGQGKISVIAVNELNLSAVADCLVDIKQAGEKPRAD